MTVHCRDVGQILGCPAGAVPRTVAPPDGTAKSANPPGRAQPLSAVSLARLLKPHSPKLFKLGTETMTQRAFGSQFVEEGFGLGGDLRIESTAAKQRAPTLGYLVFGEQS
jgi:hypothetical protein